MTTDSLEQAAASGSETTDKSVGRIALQAVAIVAIFATAYLTVSTLLTTGYTAGTTAARLGLAAVVALVAAVCLRLSTRSTPGRSGSS